MNNHGRGWYDGVAGSIAALQLQSPWLKTEPGLLCVDRQDVDIHWFTGFTDFLPPLKNMPVDWLATLNCPSIVHLDGIPYHDQYSQEKHRINHNCDMVTILSFLQKHL